MTARDAAARRREAALRLPPLDDGTRDPDARPYADDARMRQWLDGSVPVLAYTPGTPACDGSCAALGIAELVTIATHGCSRCGQPATAPGVAQ